MNEAEIAIRATEIAWGAATPLVRLIFEGLSSGKGETEATRDALKLLSERPDLEAVLPKTRAMVVAAHERVKENP